MYETTGTYPFGNSRSPPVRQDTIPWKLDCIGGKWFKYISMARSITVWLVGLITITLVHAGFQSD